MFIWKPLISPFSSVAPRVFILNNDSAAGQTWLSINFYEHKFLDWWLGLQLHRSCNTHSRVVMRFALSPEHHSGDGSSRHSRGHCPPYEKRLLHLSIMLPAGMTDKLCADRMRAVFKDTRRNYPVPLNGSFSLNLHTYPSWFWSKYIQFVFPLHLELKRRFNCLKLQSCQTTECVDFNTFRHGILWVRVYVFKCACTSMAFKNDFDFKMLLQVEYIQIHYGLEDIFFLHFNSGAYG